MSEIKIPAVELVEINSLQIDGNNPNKMTDKQFEALQENIKRFGFINPVITNKDGVIADGEHRWEAAKALGMTQVPAIKLPVSDVDRRILRQVLNKLKGEHDAVLDDAEYKYIFDQDEIGVLNMLLGENDRKLVQFMASIDKKNKEDLSSLIKKTEDYLTTMTFLISTEAEKTILEAIKKTGFDSKGEALATICQAYLNSKD